MIRTSILILTLLIGILFAGCRSRSDSQSEISAAFSEYPPLSLPLNLRMTNPEQETRWKRQPIRTASAQVLGGRGMGYAIGRIQRADHVRLCATYFESDGAPGRVLLTTHTAAGEVLGELVFAQDAQDGKIGYGGSLSPDFKIFRLEMFYVQDERSGKLRPEADHEDVFVVTNEGKFVESQR